MYYYSTRNKKLKLTSAEAIKKGLSEEGGLFVPSELPKITSKDIDNLVGKSYIDRANYILKLFLTDFTYSSCGTVRHARLRIWRFRSCRIL